MNKIYVLIGIPGSGKTTYANNTLLEEHTNIVLISTDIVRNNNPTMEEANVFPEAYRLIAYNLKEGKDVVFDATNITRKVRDRLDENLKQYEVTYEKIAIFFPTKASKCSKRVAKRNTFEGERYLPPEVTYSYEEKLEVPTLDEGFKEIIVIDNNKDLAEKYWRKK